MHAGNEVDTKSRSAVIALLLSVIIHLGMLLAIGPHPLSKPYHPLEVSLKPSENGSSSPSISLIEQSHELLPEPVAHDIDRNRWKPDISQSFPSEENSDPVKKTTYFINSEVDILAEPINRPSIVYPEQALLSKLAGKVRVRIFIDLEGRVNSLELLESQPPYGPFEEIAVNALKETRFKPAKRFGQAVNSQKVVEVLFNPYEDSAANP